MSKKTAVGKSNRIDRTDRTDRIDRMKIMMAAIAIIILLLPYSPRVAAKTADAAADTVANASHGGEVFELQFSPDGKKLASTSVDQTIKLWDVSTGKELLTIDLFGQEIDCLAFNTDGKTIAGFHSRLHGGWRSSDIGVFALFDLASGKVLRQFKGHTSAINSVAFSPDGTRMVSCSCDGTIRVWNVTTGKTLHVFSDKSAQRLATFPTYAQQVKFSPDGKLIAGVFAQKLVLWDASTGNQLRSMDVESHEPSVFTPSFRAVAFSEDGKLLACGDSHNIQLWETATGNRVNHTTLPSESDYLGDALSFHGSNVLAEGYTMDGKGSSTKSAENWNPSSGEISAVVRDSDYQVMKIDPHETKVAAVSYDETRTIKIRDLASGRELHRLSSLPQSKSITRQPLRPRQTIVEAHGVKIGKIQYLPPKTKRDPRLERVLVRTFFHEGVARENPPARYVYNIVDLNGDGSPEILALVRARECCGTGGCSGLIIQPSKGYRIIDKFSVSHELPLVSNSKTSGWNDMIWASYGGGMPLQYFTSKWGGTRYCGTHTKIKAGQVINAIDPDGYESDGIQLPVTRTIR